jgi:hypothetical protein
MNPNESNDTRDTLLIAGGAALMILGAGMILANPAIRKTLLGSLSTLIPGQDGAGGGIAGMIPDVEHYLRLRAM